MAILALRWDAAALSGDVFAATTDWPDLASAVVMSLFTDRRAEPDDVLPTQSGLVRAPLPGYAARRGWWGDSEGLFDGTDRGRIGSRLWLLGRETRRPDVLRRARLYAEEALDWLVEDGIAEAVEVTAEFQGTDRLSLLVVIRRGLGPGGDFTARYDWAWRQVATV